MSGPKPIRYDLLDWKRIIIPLPESKPGGGKFSKVSYNYGNGVTGGLLIQWPVLSSKYGYSSFADRKDPTKVKKFMSFTIDPEGPIYKWANEEYEPGLAKHVYANRESMLGAQVTIISLYKRFAHSRLYRPRSTLWIRL